MSTPELRRLLYEACRPDAAAEANVANRALHVVLPGAGAQVAEAECEVEREVGRARPTEVVGAEAPEDRKDRRLQGEG